MFYAFEDDAAVIFADVHEDGRYLYPGTGAADETGRGAAQGTKLNLPMAPGADDAALRARVAAGDRAPGEVSSPSSSSCSAAPTAWRATRSRTCALRPNSHGLAARELMRARRSPAGTGGCWPWAAGGYNRSNLAQAWNAVVENLL